MNTKLRTMLLNNASYRLCIYPSNKHNVNTWMAAVQNGHGVPQLFSMGVFAIAEEKTPEEAIAKLTKDAEEYLP